MTEVYTELLQENSELKAKVFRLEKENKELKEKVEVLDKMTGIFSARLCDTYRSALEEIRELAKCRIENLVILEKCNEVLE